MWGRPLGCRGRQDGFLGAGVPPGPCGWSASGLRAGLRVSLRMGSAEARTQVDVCTRMWSSVRWCMGEKEATPVSLSWREASSARVWAR